MRLLANENVPLDAVAALRSADHDVLWVRECFPGIVDQEVLELGQRESRIVLTFDKDFGEHAFRYRTRISTGIILFRLRLRSAQAVAEMVAKTIAARSDWCGHFSVVTPGRVRMIPLPASS